MIPIPQTTTTSKLLDAETRRTVDLKRLVRTVNAVVEDAPVTISEDGVRFHAADPSMVAMIDLQLNPEFFTQHHVAPDQPVQFEIDMDEVKTRICEARKGDTVALAVTGNDRSASDRQLHVTVDDTGMQSTFTIDTNSVDDVDKPETDDLDFAGSAVVAVDKLKDALQRMGDAAAFTLREDRLVIESDTENGQACVEFLEAGDHIHAITLADEPITAVYATDYLTHITKLKNTVNRVHLRFGTDFPLRAEANRDRFTVEYTVAPRIEE